MVVKVICGTSITGGINMVNGFFSDISWWSDNQETAEHYYEGSILEMEIKLTEDSMQYVREAKDAPNGYTYGVMKPSYPVNSTWYSFSKDYIRKNMVSIVRKDDIL